MNLMNLMKIVYAVVFFATCFVSLYRVAHAQEPQSYEAYFNYIGTRPDEGGTNYTGETQGLTHDDNHWFISQAWGVWKIPVGLDLAGSIECDTTGVLCKGLSSELSSYDHIGDITYYRYKSTGFLLLPLEGGSKPALAILSPSNLSYVAHVQLIRHTSASWVAVDSKGLVYTSSNDRPGWIYIYNLNWEALIQNRTLSLQFVGEFQLLDESGHLLPLGPQGGVFSESDDLLYISNGSTDRDYIPNTDGIHVFDTATWRRITKSTIDGSKPFFYSYDPTWWDWEEAEGLTIWDVDDKGSDRISGQLHVLQLRNGMDDVVSIFHYTNKIYVDDTYNGEEQGKPNRPFNTVSEANSLAWDGAVINIKSGLYPETVTISKRVVLQAQGGHVQIGN
ncbi:MAG: hypothetical protein KDI79_25055 [Anaerolineae bacterium]|nr:hypothetical protein [Anaerolineae bacterium]